MANSELGEADLTGLGLKTDELVAIYDDRNDPPTTPTETIHPAAISVFI
ncbi:hypothetical protein [Bradyrhizobium australafricanum]|nr:hypothetical protein [Bradyrhizobium australafricanum]MCA6105256.1 hypothetical protein [Bradyrhizobium australafricanum]